MNKDRSSIMDANSHITNAHELESTSMGSDEESFVVLGRSPTADREVPRSTLSNAPPSFAQVRPTYPMATSNDRPSNTMLNVACQHLSNNSMAMFSLDMRPEEIETKLKELLRENVDLKETIQQNNLAMKQQLITLEAWQEEVQKSHQNHREKFTEAKELIIKLRGEKEELNNALKTLKFREDVSARNAKKEQELSALTELLSRQLETAERSRRQLALDLERSQALKARLERDVVILNVELESQKQRVEALASKLKTGEGESDVIRGQMATMQSQLAEYQDVIDKLTSQLSEKGTLTNVGDLQHASSYVGEQHKTEGIQKQAERCASLESWQHVTSENGSATGSSEEVCKLQFELREAKSLLIEESKRRQESERLLSEVQQQFSNLFSDYQTALEALEELNGKRGPNTMAESYHGAQMHGYTEQIDKLTAQVMNLEDKLTHAKEELAALGERNRQLVTENETIPVLQIQMEVYQADFNAEREARENLAGEKERLAVDLRQLQRRNQQLLIEVKSHQQDVAEQHANATNGWNTISTPGRGHPRENTPPPPGSQDC